MKAPRRAARTCALALTGAGLATIVLLPGGAADPPAPFTDPAAGLVLRLPAFDAAPRREEEGGRERPGLAGLVLRLGGEQRSPTPPAGEGAVHALAPAASPPARSPDTPVSSVASALPVEPEPEPESERGVAGDPPLAPDTSEAAEAARHDPSPASTGPAAEPLQAATHGLSPAPWAAAAPLAPALSEAVPVGPAPMTELTLPLGQSRRLGLDGDATAVLVASPEIADVQLAAPNVLYVVGKSVGRTSVAVVSGDELLEERVVSVVLDLDPLHALLAGEPGLTEVRARRLPRGGGGADRRGRLRRGGRPGASPRVERPSREACRSPTSCGSGYRNR